jgi:rod shape-determining protein MreC
MWRKSLHKRGVSRRLLGIMAVGVILVVAEVAGLLGPVATVVGVVGRPVQGGLSSAGSAVGEWFSVIGDAGHLGAQNQQLRAQVASLQQQLSQATEIQAQNAQLRQQLGVGQVLGDHLIAAAVIAYQPDNFRQFITIARGSRDGVQAGMAVVEQGDLVGTVQSVSATTAKVFLVIDPNFSVAALDQNQPDRPSGIVHGQIGNGLQMDDIAQNETISAGDTIVTSGLGGSVESGLIIGQVQTTSKQDDGVFQSAQVTSNIQFSKLEIVYVVARPQ